MFGVIERTQLGDVTALWMSWARSRSIGYGVHAFVVRDVLIDTGFPGAGREMSEILESMRPRGALLTHHHEDHAGNVQLLAESGVPIGLDSETLRRVRDPGPIGLYRHYTWKAMRPLSSNFIPFVDEQLSLIPTPGHCANHHSVWDASTGTFFAGDLFLGVKVRIAHSYENPRAHVQSLRAIIARSPSRVFCAHRGLVNDGLRALNAKADWMEELITKVEQRIDAGHSDNQIRREVLGPLGSTHFVSAGDYSPVNLVAAIRKTRPNGSDGSLLA